MEKKYLSKDNIVGKQVIDSGAMIIGIVKDLAFDFEKKDIALTITDKTSGDLIVSSNDISSVGDVVLLKKRIDLLIGSSASTSVQITPSTTSVPSTTQVPEKEVFPQPKAGLCPVCNFQNDVNSKFCIKCGHKL